MALRTYLSSSDSQGTLPAAAAAATVNVASLSGLATVDGYTLQAGDLVLLTAQTTAKNRGLWVAAAGAWSRPAAMASGSTVKARTVTVINGTANAKTEWLLAAGNAGIVVDTDAQTWVLRQSPSVVIASPSSNATSMSGALVGTLPSPTLRDFQSVKDNGAKGDLVTGQTDATTVAGNTTVNFASRNFTAADQGKLIDLYGVGGHVTPPTITLTVLSTGGTLGAGTYAYRATVVTPNGESVPGPEVSVVIAAGATNSIQVTISTYPIGAGLASSINIYGRSVGAELLMTTGMSIKPHYTGNLWTDTGAIVPTGALPAVDQSAGTLSTSIANVTGVHQIVLTAPPSVSLGGVSYQYGSNDGPAFATTSANVGAGVVFIPSGNYMLDRNYAVPAHQSWAGAGKYNVVLKLQEVGQFGGGAGTYPASILVPSSYVTLKNFTIDGSRATAPEVSSDIIRVIGNVDHVECESLLVQNVVGNGAAYYANGVNRCKFRNCDTNTCGYGYVLGSSVGSLGDASNCTVRDALVEYSDWNGIYLTGDVASAPNPHTVYSNSIRGATVRGFWDTGIEVGQGNIDASISEVKVDGINSGNWTGVGANGILVRDNFGTRVAGFEVANVTGSYGGFGVCVLPQFAPMPTLNGAQATNTGTLNISAYSSTNFPTSGTATVGGLALAYTGVTLTGSNVTALTGVTGGNATVQGSGVVVTIGSLWAYAGIIQCATIEGGKVDSCTNGVSVDGMWGSSMSRIRATNCTQQGFYFKTGGMNSHAQLIAWRNGQHGINVGTGTSAYSGNTWMGCHGISNSTSAAGNYYGINLQGPVAFNAFDVNYADDDHGGGNAVTQTKAFNNAASGVFNTIGASNLTHASAQGYLGSALAGSATADHRFLQKTDVISEAVAATLTATARIDGLHGINPFNIAAGGTATLFALTTGSQAEYTIINLSAAALTVACNSGAIQNVGGTDTLNQNQSAVYVWDGTNWWRKSKT